MSADPARTGAGAGAGGGPESGGPCWPCCSRSLLVGCDVGGGDREPHRSAGSAGSLRWHACEGSTYRCARLTVPLDWEHPGGRTISLAVTKVPALHPQGRPARWS